MNNSRTNTFQNDLNADDDFPGDLLEDQTKRRTNLIQYWYALTSLPDPPVGSSFVQREAARRSRLSSGVLFFLLAVCVSLLPVTFLVISIYPTYFWLTLELICVCIVALVLLRRGYTNTCGAIVVTFSFLTITASLFSTVPFDETTLQGYDMYILLLLLCVWLLPPRSVFLFYCLSIGVIIGTLFLMPLTPVLHVDMQSRMFLIIVRPLGILFACGGVAYIAAVTLTSTRRRANRAETIAFLEHEQLRVRADLSSEINKIVHTQVQVSNGNLSARVPLSDMRFFLQVARSLNMLFIRYQRAAHAEQQLRAVDLAVADLVTQFRRAKTEGTFLLQTSDPHLVPLIAELQDVVRSHSRGGRA